MKQTKEQANAKRRARYQYKKARAALSSKVKTASDLKYANECYVEGSLYFTRDSKKFFGDTMANYGVNRVQVLERFNDKPVEAFELYRRRAVKHGLHSSTYFSAETFEQMFIEKEVN